MKNMFIYFLALLLWSCSSQNQNSDSFDKNQDTIQILVPIILPVSLEDRRPEFTGFVNAALMNIRQFSEEYGWTELTKEQFMDTVMVFEDKHQFNFTLLTLAEADTSMDLPDTYCAALEKRILLTVTPEFYSTVYPEGIEEQSFEKLLTHEIAHRLHIRILNGDENAMGPIWFYEGFATFAANQFSASGLILSNDDMIQIMNDPDRGSYMKYNYIFRYFVSKIPLKELINMAKDESFNERLIEILR